MFVMFRYKFVCINLVFFRNVVATCATKWVVNVDYTFLLKFFSIFFFFVIHSNFNSYSECFFFCCWFSNKQMYANLLNELRICNLQVF